MSKMVKKRDLPQKVCPACNRPFSWRKRWRNAWPLIVYCSDRCRSHHPKSQPDLTP